MAAGPNPNPKAGPAADRAPRELSYCGAQVRRLDPDRYLTALFAPPSRRESLMALYAFNAEVARVRESVSEPMMGLIRLQWWRDSIAGIYAGAPRRHAVVEPLAEAVRKHALPRAPFDRLIDAREQDMSADPPPTLASLLAYADATSGGLVELALGVLRGDTTVASAAVIQAGSEVGTAWALTGLLRAVPFHARHRRIHLPADLLDKHGALRRDVLELRPTAALAGASREIADLAGEHLAAARRVSVPRPLLSPFLLAPLAALYLRRLRGAGYDVFDPRVGASPPGRLWRLLLPAALGRV